MTCQPYNIKIVEDNSFALLFTLKKRTYVSNVPIDEDIVATDLTDVTLRVGDTEYATELGSDGVRVLFPEGLKRGTYNVVLRAKYHGSDITAAYFEAITSVQWNYQSDAEQFVQGSPIAMDAAYVIGGVLTDAELAALKVQYREAIAAARQAEADAQAAKEAFDTKAEALDGVAKESTSQEILTAIGGIDFSELAKQGNNPNATNTAIYQLVLDEGIVNAHEYAQDINEIIGDWSNE